ncbi:glycosyltransferase [Thiohalobacter sp.]|uniref:glycosyltransferase n=1 Tax=Thiohalobacter sp. TaxID=2025948 RepID=UPI002607AEB1|nr:glycosyltransferase [Thiohalobacter sp.]
MNAATERPRLVVFSSLFPSPAQPSAGVFVRERMFRVGRVLPVTVVSPQPWFPLQSLIRAFVPRYRPPAPGFEIMDGVEVYRPRFLALPGVLRRLDGLSMALSSLRCVRRLKQTGRADLIDAHFSFPDGRAATLIGRWLGLPVTITLRGTEVPHLRTTRRPQLLAAWRDARHLFSVSESLRRVAIERGVPAEKIEVVGNGVDVERFHPVPRHQAREALGLPDDAEVLVTVGGLVERKGFHRVIEVLPRLLKNHTRLHYLIVGGATAEGDWRDRLQAQVRDLGIEQRVHFLGALPPDQLKNPLSAADLFVLSTRNEGWANVLLEAMACGLPVITTDVGGNAEVVCRPELGRIVPFGDADALARVLDEALAQRWDRAAIRAHACANGWDERVKRLVSRFCSLARPPGTTAGTAEHVQS